ncbi:S-methyl-5-thioribose-1-phosphate isomerase [bacterium]|nr:MAG: S-methyl-5-thioribose-1-phosphate isomerase [bacterium]
MTTPTVQYEPGCVRLLDQTRLPAVEEILDCHSIDALVDAIRRLVVRGAPAIGVAAAWGVVLSAHLNRDGDFFAAVQKDIATLRAARPTAVNLGWALDRLGVELDAIKQQGVDPERALVYLTEAAEKIHQEDIELCERMGRYGAELLPDEATIITHCNTGALATAGIGTALGVVFAAVEAGKRVKVFADETRPLLQGARLTAWELQRAGIEVEVICDGAAGWTLHTQHIDAVFVGSDRIAANGDVANKIGTYPLAVLARRHGVPFYVVAPYSTLDLSLASGAEIPIELRDPAEVTRFGDLATAPEGVGAFNPAFDVTPAELVTGIVTEKGVFRAPFEEGLRGGYAAAD